MARCDLVDMGKSFRQAFHKPAAWRLSLYGLRRGEVLGRTLGRRRPEGQDADRQPGRVLVDYKVRIEEPKSHNGQRTLPLDDELVAVLAALRKRQAQDTEAVGTPYRPASTNSAGTPPGTSTW